MRYSTIHKYGKRHSIIQLPPNQHYSQVPLSVGLERFRSNIQCYELIDIDNLNSFLKTSLDGSVGLIFETLRNAGVDSNTFVFFTADNGYVIISMFNY